MMVGGCMNGMIHCYYFDINRRIYDYKKTLNQSGSIHCVDISDQTYVLIAGGSSSKLVIYKFISLNQMFNTTPFQILTDATDDIMACDISDDGNTIVTGSRDSSVRVY